MLDKIPLLEARWRESNFTDAEFSTLYFLCWQIHKHGSRFAARVSRAYVKPDCNRLLDEACALPQAQYSEFLAQLMARYRFLGVIPAVNMALAQWLAGHWSLRLCTYIPTPAQVLAMQVAGIRPVTIIADASRLHSPVLKKENAFEFMLHDLEHAYQFFHDTDLHNEQRALFAFLQLILDQGLFTPYTTDTDYQHRLTYLLSDMNTRAAHALQYMRAMFVDYFLRRDGKSWQETISSQAGDELHDWVDRLAQAGDFNVQERDVLHLFFNGHYDDAILRQLVALLRDFANRRKYTDHTRSIAGNAIDVAVS